MGRWAQRRRGAGGGGPDNTIRMTAASHDAFVTATVTYNADVTAGDFDPGAYTSDPSGSPGDITAQGAANEVVITFLGDVSADTQLTYTGATAAVETPQTINYT